MKEVKFVANLPNGENYVLSGEVQKNAVVLNIAITNELKQEGIAREIIRHGQILRREANYALNDRINILFHTDDDDLKQAFAANGAMIMDALQADTVLGTKEKTDAEVELVIDGQKATLAVVR